MNSSLAKGQSIWEYRVHLIDENGLCVPNYAWEIKNAALPQQQQQKRKSGHVTKPKTVFIESQNDIVFNIFSSLFPVVIVHMPTCTQIIMIYQQTLGLA